MGFTTGVSSTHLFTLLPGHLLRVGSEFLVREFVEFLDQNKIERTVRLKPPEQRSPIKPQCPAKAAG